MRKRKYFLLPTMFLLFLSTGCGGVTKEDIAKEKREYIEFQYLNFEALKNLDTYPHDKLSDKTYENFIKKNKDNFVRWTAPVIEVFPLSDVIRLGVEGLPKIEAEFEYDITDKDEKEFKKGTILTVSCHPDDYINGVLGRPIWGLKNCRIEKTKENEKAELMAYKDQLKRKKSDLAKVEAGNVQKQKEQEAIEKEQKAIEAAKLEEHAKTPEGKKEFLGNVVHKALGKKIGDTKTLVDIRNEGNNWTIELNTVSSITKNMTRNGILSDSQKVFQEVYSKNDNYDSILLVWLAEVVDVKGHVSIAPVMKIEMTNTNAKSINWNNFDYKNFSVVADTFWDSGIFE